MEPQVFLLAYPCQIAQVIDRARIDCACISYHCNRPQTSCSIRTNLLLQRGRVHTETTIYWNPAKGLLPQAEKIHALASPHMRFRRAINDEPLVIALQSFFAHIEASLRMPGNCHA